MSEIRRPLAVLFDLDGTLVDTAPDLIGAMNELLGELGRAPVVAGTLRHEASNGSRGLLRATLGLGPEDPTYRSHQQRFLALYADRLALASRPFTGVAELLSGLAARSIRWGVVTNKPGYLARPLLAHLDLHPAVVLGGDSSPRPKPAPDSLHLACSHLRVAPQHCWYVGDARRDIDAANHAGMHPVAAAYGYIDDTDQIADWPVEAVIYQPPELLLHLDRAGDSA